MNYLCLIYRDEAKQPDLASPLGDNSFPWAEPSHFQMNTPHLVQEAITIRVRNHHVVIAEGARAQAQHPLAEFCLIQARDLNDAIRIAARLPPAHLGLIEIRGIVGESCREVGEPNAHESR